MNRYRHYTDYKHYTLEGHKSDCPACQAGVPIKQVCHIAERDSNGKPTGRTVVIEQSKLDKMIKDAQMKKSSKASYEKMMEIFDATHKICTWAGIQEWQNELQKNGWTDEEFDAELTKRMFAKKTA